MILLLFIFKAGGEAALMPSPTRTITPGHSPIQSKRKLETTISMDNAALKKKEKTGGSMLFNKDSVGELESTEILMSPMDTDKSNVELAENKIKIPEQLNFSLKDMEIINDVCDELMLPEKQKQNAQVTEAELDKAASSLSLARQKTITKLDTVEKKSEQLSSIKEPSKVLKKFVNRHKTVDLVNTIGKLHENEVDSNIANNTSTSTTTPLVLPITRKGSFQDDAVLCKANMERRKSRILETAEKFQQMNSMSNAIPEKPKKIVIPGVSVGNFKREFERRASCTNVLPTPVAGERRMLEQIATGSTTATENTISAGNDNINAKDSTVDKTASTKTLDKEHDQQERLQNDSKNLSAAISLEEARRSMENSIALLHKAKTESSQEVNQLCAKTENISVSDIPAKSKSSIAAKSNTSAMSNTERERVLKNARAIIGNAIQPG